MGRNNVLPIFSQLILCLTPPFAHYSRRRRNTLGAGGRRGRRRCRGCSDRGPVARLIRQHGLAVLGAAINGRSRKRRNDHGERESQNPPIGIAHEGDPGDRNRQPDRNAVSGLRISSRVSLKPCHANTLVAVVDVPPPECAGYRGQH